jgi:uncharacterized protein YneF (UPF0154 family)
MHLIPLPIVALVSLSGLVGYVIGFWIGHKTTDREIEDIKNKCCIMHKEC